MASKKSSLSALAAALIACPLIGQTQAPAAAALATITITQERAARRAEVSGFGDAPISELPISVLVVDGEQLRASGQRRLADLTQADAAITDSYNAQGYWDFLTIRGFTLDNSANYRRDGLPISTQTFIAQDNKERVEILKGASGIQAGTSAPGGLVNYVVKRPTETPLRSASLSLTGLGGVRLQGDISDRYGIDRENGYRLNFATEAMKGYADNTDGSRRLLALALDRRLGRDTLIEAEVEYSRRAQPSAAGFSLLGTQLPTPPNPAININNQSWSQPVVLQGGTASLRIEQGLAGDTRWSAHYMRQQLKSDDRLAYPFSCYYTPNPDGVYAYCPDGSFSFFDYRSDSERRQQDALQLKLMGRNAALGAVNDWAFGWLSSRYSETKPPMFTFNDVGVPGSFLGNVAVPASPQALSYTSNKTETSQEFSALLRSRWTAQWNTWAGLRHTRFDRSSESANPQDPNKTRMQDSLNTPWMALSHQSLGITRYASVGYGAEQFSTPNDATTFNHPGSPLGLGRSRQLEVGIKSEGPKLRWGLAAFDIVRPLALDTIDPLTYLSERSYSGNAHHRGLEAQGALKSGVWQWAGSAMLLNAKQEGAVGNPQVNGQSPVNVPAKSVRAQVAYAPQWASGLSTSLGLHYEGERNATLNGALQIPAWTTFSAALDYRTRFAGQALHWQLAVSNLTDRRYWRESVAQYTHYYLLAGEPRAVRLTVSADL